MSLLTFDRAGVVLSTLCLAHCILLPLAASVLPIAGVLSENEMIHKALVLFAIIPAFFAFTAVTYSKFAPMIRGFGALGIIILLMGAFIEPLHDFETILTMIGAVSLANTHIFRIIVNKSHSH
ncbi:MAG: MerC domain-containing protein [Litorimonas sp.]